LKGYILRRVLAAVPVILMVGIIVFSLLHIAPGDPAAIIAGDDVRPEDVEEIRVALGLDRAFHIQFGIWVWKLLQGDLGTSIFSNRSIVTLLVPRLQPTLGLASMALVMTILFGVPLGILAAWKAHSLIDRGVMVFAVVGFAVPAFFLGFLLIWAFAVNWNFFPTYGYSPVSDGLFGYLKSLFLPALSIAISSTALVARMTRSTMMEVLNDDYIRTARAKGLNERTVMVRHAFRAASIPVVTVIGLVFAGLIVGVVVAEVVFSIPGVGRLIVDAVVRRDYPVVQGMLMVVATSYIFVNLLVDILYAYLDPRIKY
jgi:peptide/nickel transport system permease protein